MAEINLNQEGLPIDLGTVSMKKKEERTSDELVETMSKQNAEMFKIIKSEMKVVEDLKNYKENNYNKEETKGFSFNKIGKYFTGQLYKPFSGMFNKIEEITGFNLKDTLEEKKQKNIKKKQEESVRKKYESVIKSVETNTGFLFSKDEGIREKQYNLLKDTLELMGDNFKGSLSGLVKSLEGELKNLENGKDYIKSEDTIISKSKKSKKSRKVSKDYDFGVPNISTGSNIDIPKLFGFENKSEPTRNYLLANGGIFGKLGVYIGDVLSKGKISENEGQEGGLLGNLKNLGNFSKNILGNIAKFFGNIGTVLSNTFNSILTKLPSLLTKAMPVISIVSIVAGIALMIKDGIAGIFKSKEWGSSKVSGFLGGALAGSAKGFKGAIANLGKWALLGFGIGLPIAPPIGAIAGTLIGAAIGGVLGFLGGQKVANFFDSIGKNLMGVFNNIKDFFINAFNFVGKIKDALLKNPIVNFIISEIKTVFEIITLPFRSLITAFKNTFKGITDIITGEGSIPEKILGVIKEIVLFVPKLIINFIVSFVDNIRDLIVGIFVGNKEKGEKSLVNKFTDMISFIWQGIFNIGNIIKDAVFNFIGGIGKGIMNVFNKIRSGDFLGLFNDILVGVKNIFTFIGNLIFFIPNKLSEGLRQFDFSSFADNIISPIKDFFNSIFTSLKNMLGDLIGYFTSGAFLDTKNTFESYQVKRNDERLQLEAIKKSESVPIKENNRIAKEQKADELKAKENDNKIMESLLMQGMENKEIQQKQLKTQETIAKNTSETTSPAPTVSSFKDTGSTGLEYIKISKG